jgi:hypothetical protein
VALGLGTALGLGLQVPAYGAAEAPVATILRILPLDSNPATGIRILRHGKALPSVAARTPLMIGDEIFVADARTVLIVYMTASTETFQVHKSTRAPPATEFPDWVVPDPGVPGVAPPVFVRLFHWWLDEPQAELAEQPAGARGSGQVCYNTAKTNAPTPFEVPLLMADHSNLVAGRRALFVVWRGGVSPFDVRLAVAGTGQRIAATHVDGACQGRLAQVDLEPGRYRLSVTDALGIVSEQDDLRVVPAGPALPPELVTSNLPQNAVTLYSATWLLHQEKLSWAFEALQRVDSLDCQVPAVRGWLTERGASTPCATPAKPAP